MSVLEWKGHPVPWVTRWSGEVVWVPVQVGQREDGAVVAFYEDGREVRDDNGVLWMREGINRAGEPQFSEVSAFRQRAAMRRRLCQVCGEKIASPVIRWLVHEAQLHRQADGSVVTISPPTCDDCVDLSMNVCPRMKRADGRIIAKVLEYEIWGVWGTVARFGEDGAGQTTGKNLINYHRTDYPFGWKQVIAKQQAVRWTKFTLEA